MCTLQNSFFSHFTQPSVVLFEFSPEFDVQMCNCLKINSGLQSKNVFSVFNKFSSWNAPGISGRCSCLSYKPFMIIQGWNQSVDNIFFHRHQILQVNNTSDIKIWWYILNFVAKSQQDWCCVKFWKQNTVWSIETLHNLQKLAKKWSDIIFSYFVYNWQYLL